MLRLARVCLGFLALAGAACSEEPAARDPNQPAGKVVEMAGDVSATREGAASRPLAVGAPVFADDTVTTGSDGSAVILLAHNQVRWSLGQGKSARVDRSLAWKASGDQGGSAFDDEDEMATASAGRHTDREAGDTAATAQLPPAAASSEGAVESAPAAPPPPPADTVAQAEPKSSKGATRSMRRKSPSGSGDGLLADKELGGDSVLDQPSGGGGGTRGGSPAGRAAAAAPPAPTAAPSPEIATAARPSAAGNLVLGKLTARGPLSAAQIGPRLAALGKSCRGTVAGKVTLRFDIDGKGAVVNVRLSGPSNVVAPISSCLSAAARGLTFPTASGTTAVEREIQVSPVR